jgi:type VII secretion-associated serine protease mycosin
MLSPARGAGTAAWVAAACLAITGPASPRAATFRALPGQGIGSQVRAAELPELKAMHVTAAWRISRGHGVTVGVLDTGVDQGAPDLVGTVTSGPDFTRGSDPPGYRPPHLHGTYIASLIAGHGSGPGRADGVIGVAPAARILSVRVLLDDSEPGFNFYNDNAAYRDAVGDGIRYAVNHGVGVINLSLGSPSPTRNTRAAVGYAIAHGVVVVAAAGNDGSAGPGFTPYSYPASFTGVISVGALTARATRASFSQRNSSVVISAPGVGIVGAGPHGGYLQADGTSPASAFVSGVAALILARYPGLSPAMVQQALETSTRHGPPAGYDPGTGFGEVDAVAALRAARALASARPAAAMAASRYFGTAPRGPIQVVHRDLARIEAEGGLAALAGFGFLAALVMLGVLIRRSVRDRRARRAGAAYAWPTARK